VPSDDAESGEGQVPQPLETIDPYNPPPGYDGPLPLETIDPYNPPPGYDGPLPVDPSNAPSESGESGPGDFPYDPNDPNRNA
jgi:hypothetical protein